MNPSSLLATSDASSYDMRHLSIWYFVPIEKKRAGNPQTHNWRRVYQRLHTNTQFSTATRGMASETNRLSPGFSKGPVTVHLLYSFLCQMHNHPLTTFRINTYEKTGEGGPRR